MKYLYALLLLPVLAIADWVPTRTSAYFWQCQDAAGVKISDHQSSDYAMAACSNLTLKDGKSRYVQGGRWRITSTASSSSSSSSSASSSSSSSSAPVTAILTWTPPTHNTDGSAVNLTGYRIYYGTSTALTQSTAIGVGNTYTLPLPAHGTWYFAMTAVNSAGVESARSATVSVVK